MMVRSCLVGEKFGSPNEIKLVNLDHLAELFEAVIKIMIRYDGREWKSQ